MPPPPPPPPHQLKLYFYVDHNYRRIGTAGMKSWESKIYSELAGKRSMSVWNEASTDNGIKCKTMYSHSEDSKKKIIEKTCQSVELDWFWLDFLFIRHKMRKSCMDTVCERVESIFWWIATFVNMNFLLLYIHTHTYMAFGGAKVVSNSRINYLMFNHPVY